MSTFEEEMTVRLNKRQLALERLVEAVRPIPALLEDLGHKRSAAALHEALFALDAATQEIAQLARQRPEEFLSALLSDRPLRR